MTPVFDKEHKILGYLDAQAHRDERTFKRVAYDPLSLVATFPPERIESESIVTTQECVFQWSSISSHRDGEIYHCDALIVSNPECLDRIRGFKWFAEVHGKRIPRLDAKIS